MVASLIWPSISQSQISTNNPPVLTIELGKNEIKASTPLQDNHLIYAVKIKNKSTVFKRSLQKGTLTKIFEFNENEEADKSGNLWAGLPPNLALSPDKNQLAFIDQEGLKIYDLSSGKSRNLILKINHKNKQETPSWSVSALKETYDLARPLWSADGKYISFLESHEEDASFGLIEVESGNYLSTILSGGYQNLTWSPIGHSFVKPFSEANLDSGLHVSSDNITKTIDISKKINKGNAFFFEANFSPDAQKLVFIYSDKAIGEKIPDSQVLAIANSDGQTFTILKENVTLQSPVFTPLGDEVFFLQKKEKIVLKKYNLKTKEIKKVAVLPTDFNHWQTFWTREGFLCLNGTSTSSDLVLGGDETLLLILDVPNSKLIYASPIFNQFVTFTGLVK